MKHFMKTIYLILFLSFVIFSVTSGLAKEKEEIYSKKYISNYLSGIISLDLNETENGFKFLNKIDSLKEKHNNFNIRFINSLILLEKFDEAFVFSKSISSKNKIFFEADLLLGLDSYTKKDYEIAEKYFKRLNKTSDSSMIFDDLFGNILMSWLEASKGNKEESLKFVNRVPNKFYSLKLIQNSFLQCYFDSLDTPNLYTQVIDENELDFSRYNFFLLNYFISKNKNEEIVKLVKKMKSLKNKNLLLKESINFVNSGKEKKITDLFNCKNPKDSIAEIFYIIANLYSTEKNFQKSNFYLNISLFLNNKFTPNKALRAENFFYLGDEKLSKELYESLKKIGPAYSWFATKSIGAILLNSKNKKKYAVSYVEKEFKRLPDHNFEHYYELGNFYKDNNFYKQAIEFYSKALENINAKHTLVPKILDKRGTCFERLNMWKEAEDDLKKSLQILPDQAYVLNYLAYSWIEKKINIREALKMLAKADNLKKNDPYIKDSLGWAHYANKNYVEAEKFLRLAVILLPLDPTINDHYGDTLWMLQKPIQARYFWSFVLNLDNTEKELKEIIAKKITFGVPKKL